MSFSEEHTDHDSHSSIIDLSVRWWLQLAIRENPAVDNAVIFARATIIFKNEQRALLGSFDSFSHTISRIKKRFQPSLPVPTFLEALDTSLFSKTKYGQRFLLFDEVLKDTSRIIGYATDEALDSLLTCDTWLVDGTFQVCPSLFDQLWVVHVSLEGKVSPMAYFLFKGKHAKKYIEFLGFFKKKLAERFDANTAPSSDLQQPPQCRGLVAPEATQAPSVTPTGQLGPQFLVLDFETGQAQAFAKAFPGAVQQGFFFHFRQRINRKVRALKGLRKLRTKDTTDKCRETIALYIALAFIPTKQIRAALAEIKETDYYLAHE